MSGIYSHCCDNETLEFVKFLSDLNLTHRLWFVKIFAQTPFKHMFLHVSDRWIDVLKSELLFRFFDCQGLKGHRGELESLNLMEFKIFNIQNVLNI